MGEIVKKIIRITDHRLENNLICGLQIILQRLIQIMGYFLPKKTKTDPQIII